MEEEMEGVETIDLTNDSFREFQNEGQAMSDEDFAKRLQMEEYETLRASDFLVAQQLQEELQMDDSRHLHFDPRLHRPSREDIALRQLFYPRPVHRRLHMVRLAPTNGSSDDSDGSASGSASGSVDAYRHNRMHRATMRNRARQEAEGSSSQSSNSITNGNTGTLEHDSPPPIPQRHFRHGRRSAENSTAVDGRPRIRFTNGHRFHMLHPFIRIRDPYLHMLDYDDGSGNNYDALWDLSERIGDAGSKGLSKAEINRLPTTKYKTSDLNMTSPFDAENLNVSDHGMASYSDAASAKDRDCQICLGGFLNDDLLRILPCCHRFHVACIDEWIKNNAICPVCRDDIRSHIRRRHDDWGHADNLTS